MYKQIEGMMSAEVDYLGDVLFFLHGRCLSESGLPTGGTYKLLKDVIEYTKANS
jgi:hypothetical protein